MSRFKTTYYEEGDVLYTFIDKPEEAFTETDDTAGLLYRTSIHTDKPCGVTVLDFKYTYGMLGADALAFNIYHFFKEFVTLKEVEDTIFDLLGYKRNLDSNQKKGPS